MIQPLQRAIVLLGLDRLLRREPPTHVFSQRCLTYVLTVGCVGMVPLAWSIWRLWVDPPHPAWFALAVLALLNGPLSIRMPSMRATISVSEGVLFTAVLLFGPATATVVAALDGLAVALWSRKRNGPQTFFGVAEPALSLWVGSWLFYILADVPPLLQQASTFSVLLMPLFVLMIVYFGLNTLLAGTAVWLDTGCALGTLLRRHASNLAVNACVGLSVAAAVIQTSGSPALATIVVLLPMLLAGYISTHHTAGRLEDTNRHLVELRRLYDSTVETLAMAIDAKDQVTHGHIRRVQVASSRLARNIGAHESDIKALEAAALLHDLGKLAVPEHILNKPGRLTTAEFEEMKKHAPIGASILSGIEFPFPVVPIVKHHHENWDGTGYPDGLKGVEIPLGARILAVVDCYDALTSDRPYRRRMTHDDAIEIIRNRRGSMYDPEVVDAFLNLPPVADEYDDEPLVDIRPLGGRLTHATLAMSDTTPDLVRVQSAPTQHTRVSQFAASLRGLTWPEAGRSIATFVPNTLPDTVAALFVRDPETGRLRLAGRDPGFDARIPAEIALGHGVTGWVGATAQPMVNADAELDLGEVARMANPPLRLCMSTPLLSGTETMGVLTIYSPYAFNETDRMVIDALTAQIPSALSPARLSSLSPFPIVRSAIPA